MRAQQGPANCGAMRLSRVGPRACTNTHMVVLWYNGTLAAVLSLRDNVLICLCI